MSNVVSIFTSSKAKCVICCDVLRIPGFPLNKHGVCCICIPSKTYQDMIATLKGDKDDL